MRDKKHLIAAILCAITAGISLLFLIANDADLRSPFIKIASFSICLVSAFGSVTFFRMHLDVMESLELERLRQLQEQYDVLCPLCASANVIIRKGTIYCLECGRASLLKKSLILKKVEADVREKEG